MNENAVFFFPEAKKKKQLWDRMNEWHVNFSLEKKKTHINSRKCGKKKTQPTYVKKRGPHQNRNEWPINFSSEIKKNKLYFFFPRSAEKKKHDFRIWMNEWPTSMPAEKKNTVPLIRQIYNSPTNWNCIQSFKKKSLICCNQRNQWFSITIPYYRYS